MYSKLLIIFIGICLLCLLYIWYKKTNDKFNKLTTKHKGIKMNKENNQTHNIKQNSFEEKKLKKFYMMKLRMKLKKKIKIL